MLVYSPPTHTPAHAHTLSYTPAHTPAHPRMKNEIDQIGNDIAKQMFSALTETPSHDTPHVSIKEKIKLLKDKTPLLSISEKKEIGKILIANNFRSYIKENSEGTVINLDALPEHIITQIYNMFIYILHNKK